MRDLLAVAKLRVINSLVDGPDRRSSGFRYSPRDAISTSRIFAFHFLT